MKKLVEQLKECASTSHWAAVINSFSGFLSELDIDFCHWMYDIGNEVPLRVQGYLICLKIAAEQLSYKIRMGDLAAER